VFSFFRLRRSAERFGSDQSAVCCFHKDTLRDTMVSIFHVGARDGFVPFDYPEIFDSCCEFVMIDAADLEEIAAITLFNGRVVNCFSTQIKSAIWNENSQRPLNVTACPYAASVKKLDEKYNDWYVFANGDCDYILGEAHTLTNVEIVETVTLAKIISESNLPTPSVLCIDAQGSSFEILQGAGSYLDSIDAVICEVELIPFYGGNPSFSGVLNLLSAKGMIFSGFISEPVSWASPVRHPIGFRSKTMLGSADAVFIRRPEEINASFDTVRISNYVLVSCSLGHFDLALSVLQKIDFSSESLQSDSVLIKFFSDLKLALAAMPVCFPPTFLEARSKTKIPQIENLLFGEITPLEECLIQYQFTMLASQVKNLRLEQVKKISNYQT
jgi:FkbM family methyltransferase